MPLRPLIQVRTNVRFTAESHKFFRRTSYFLQGLVPFTFTVVAGQTAFAKVLDKCATFIGTLDPDGEFWSALPLDQAFVRLAIVVSIATCLRIGYVFFAKRFKKTWFYRLPTVGLVLSVVVIIVTYLEESPCHPFNTLSEMPGEGQWILVAVEAVFVAIPLALANWARKMETAYGT